MILTKEVTVRIMYRNIEHFRSLGYEVQNGDIITVSIEHISPQSNIKIEVKCDYCGNIKTIKYQNYVFNTNFGERKYACCTKCAESKNIETNLKKYGVKYPQQNKEIRNKSMETNIKKYGTPNVSQSEYFKQKYKETMNEKYGVDNGFQLEEIKEKSKQTMIEKYGVEYNMQREEMKDKYLNGDKNNFYIDGRHEFYEDNWTSNSEARRVRVKVFRRDNKTCQCCGLKKRDINAHHLFSRNTHPELIYEESNLITLCKECHTEFHTKYGFGNNTPEQYEEFIKNKSQETIENVDARVNTTSKSE